MGINIFAQLEYGCFCGHNISTSISRSTYLCCQFGFLHVTLFTTVFYGLINRIVIAIIYLSQNVLNTSGNNFWGRLSAILSIRLFDHNTTEFNTMKWPNILSFFKNKLC